MAQTSSDFLEKGRRALADGDRAAAFAAFGQITDTALTTQIPWMALAETCFKAGDLVGEQAALEARIKSARGDLQAILAMAEAKRSGGGDARAPASYYKLALATAAQMGTVPQSMHPGLQRAQEFLIAHERQLAAQLFARLDALGVRAAGAPPRIAESLRLLAGEQELYLQQPSMFYFPGLAQRPWWDAAEFAWARDVEAATDAITAELNALLAGAEAFTPYVQSSSDRPPPNNPLLDKPDWGAAWLLRDGEVADGMAAACPATLAALALAPQPVIPHRAPLALFSRLKPGTHILPHHGMLNTRLICHLPLIVPDGCGLRVGGETREWQRGKLTIFDDSFEHEAWNRGNSDRTVLLFEIWRPDLTSEERDQLTRIFAAIDDYDVN